MIKQLPQRIVRLFLLGFISLFFFSRLQAQIITTVAGTGTSGYSGDGGPATAAQLKYPAGMALDASGNLFIADQYNNRIRKIDANGVITTIAGKGTTGYTGDGGSATAAQLTYPQDIVFDKAGNLIIVDYGNSRIRKVGTDGIITTIAGNSYGSYSGDGGPAKNANLYMPQHIAIDAAGNLYITDLNNNRVRKIDTNGIMTTVAGNSGQGYNRDGIQATAATLYFPTGVAVDATGNLFITDGSNNRVRKVGTDGIIKTVAGNGSYGYSGDGGPATAAKLNHPAGLAVDKDGNLFIADRGNNCVRKVDASGTITTVVGTGEKGYSGDGGVATAAKLDGPFDLLVDPAGNLFISDWNNQVIRRVGAAAPVLSNNANLSSLSVSNASLSTPFASETTDYNVSVGYTTTSLNVTAATADAEAKLQWGATPLTSGQVFNVPLSVGSNTVTLLVTAPDGTTQKTYTLTINRAAAAGQTITFNPIDEKTYGQGDFTVTASASSSMPLSFSSSNTGVATVSASGTVHILGAGTTTITASQAGGDGYAAAAPVERTLTVKPASLTITANDQCVVLGNALPTLTASYLGFVNDQGPGSLLSPPALTVAANAASAPGSYAITAAGAVSPNYIIQYRAGTLRVVGAPTLSASGPTSVLQGAPSVVLTATGCAGTIHWSGPAGNTTGSSITVPTTALGQFTYSAACTVGACTSPSTSLTVQVSPASPTTSNCLSFAALCSGNPQEVRTVNFTAPSEGDYQLVLTYLAPEKAVTALVRIDGVARTLGLSRATTYQNQSLGTLHLTAGSHTFQMGAGAIGNYLCFNGLCLTPSGSSGATSCNFAVSVSSASTSVSCGAPVSLTALCNGPDCAGVGYQWSGSGLNGSGTTASLAAPTDNGSYTYSVTAFLPGCTNQTAQTTLVVSGCSPVTSPSSNSICTTFAEVCSGNTSEVRTQRFTVASEGDYELRLSYKAPERASTGIVVLDGTSRTVGFALARSYGYQSLGTIHLTAGTHTVQLSAAAAGNFLCFNGVCVIGSGNNSNPNCNFSLTSSASGNAPSCGSSVTLTAGCAGGGCEGISYHWQGSGVDGNSASVSFAVPSANGNYTYTATASKFGCPSQTTYQTLVVSGCGPATPAPSNPCTTFAEVCSGNPKEVRSQTVTVASEGDYELLISYKAPERAVGGKVVINGTTRTMDLARTATYQQQTAGIIHLTAGTHILQLSVGAVGQYACFNGVCLKGAGSPPPPPRLQAGRQEHGILRVLVLGNPIVSSAVEVEVSGVEGQALRLQLTDGQGRILTDRSIPQAGIVERHRLESSTKGLLLLRVSAGSQSQTVKLVKP